MTPIGPNHQWRQLVAAAVLGADRAAGRLPVLQGAVARILAAKPVDDSARLLQAAAVMSVYERAGRRPSDAFGELPRQCDDESTPACSFRTGQHLARILHGEFGFLLREWCTLAAKCGVRAPVELLPPLLDRFTASRDQVCEPAVLGQRGRWLAALNPEWRAVLPGDSDDPREIWKTGEKAQRLLLIRRLHSVNSAGARQLIEQTWETENAEDRADIVAALAIGLSPDDEAFLEAALDDGRKTVRQAAADLLARLPASAFCGRMTARATAMVSLELQKRLLRGGKLCLDVTLPEKPDKSVLRDGVENKRSCGMGERAHVLCQVVAAAKLEAWEACGAPPAQIISVAAESDWREPLLSGWARAAARQKSTLWAQPILRARLASGDDFDSDEAGQLVWALDPAGREQVLTGAFQEPKSVLPRSVPLLEFCQHDWSQEFSRIALGAMRDFFGTRDAYSAHALRTSFKQRIAQYLSPAVAGEVENGWNRTDSNWHNGDEELVTALAATLSFRRAMHEELSR